MHSMYCRIGDTLPSDLVALERGDLTSLSGEAGALLFGWSLLKVAVSIEDFIRGTSYSMVAPHLGDWSGLQLVGEYC